MKRRSFLKALGISLLAPAFCSELLQAQQKAAVLEKEIPEKISQIWHVNPNGGYAYFNETTMGLSSIKPLVRFRKYADINKTQKTFMQKSYKWKVYSEI